MGIAFQCLILLNVSSIQEYEAAIVMCYMWGHQDVVVLHCKRSHSVMESYEEIVTARHSIESVSTA